MAGGENDAWASTIFERSRWCKRRPYGLSARALSVSYSYIRNSKDDKQVCNRRLSSAAIMTPFCQRDLGSQAPPLFSRALKRSGDETSKFQPLSR